MLIWVIGASGMLGSSICRKCREKKIPFIASFKKEADITNFLSLERFVKDKKMTHIINAAAYTNVEEAEKNVSLSYAVNAEGVENIAKIATKIKAKLIHFSTDYVFSGKTPLSYKEEDRCSPLNVYGASKLEGEKRLSFYCSSFCLIRTSWLFGWDGKNFVSNMIELMKKKKEIRVVDDQIGRATFCEDLVDATFSLLEEKGKFHFANKGKISWYQFAKKIYQCFCNKDFVCTRILPVATKDFVMIAKRPAFSVLDTTKIEKKIPIPTIDDALKRYAKKT